MSAANTGPLAPVGMAFSPSVHGVASAWMPVGAAAALVMLASNIPVKPGVQGGAMRLVRLIPILLACVFATAAAAEYPDKPIRFVVPQAPGSATDTVARILGAELAKEIGQQLLAAAPDAPFKNIPELIAYAKANPGKLSNASSSNGSPGHVGGELFKFMTGTDIVHVPYRGGAAAINDLIAGRVQLMFESLNSIAPHARAGTVRALGVSGERRSPGFPELPTVAEAGVPGYEAPTWSGIIAPASVPRPIVDKLNAAINRAIASQTFKDRFAMIGDEPAGGTPEEFAELIRADSAKWGEVVRRSGARLD